MIGVPPPDGLPRECWASWYWTEIQEAAAEHSDHISPATECIAIKDLISGATDAGVVGHCIPVAGFAEPQPFHWLVAPYRRGDPG